ncbi:MAG: hypothetical protein U1E34_01620 [Amaricoccus sp.]
MAIAGFAPPVQAFPERPRRRPPRRFPRGLRRSATARGPSTCGPPPAPTLRTPAFAELPEPAYPLRDLGPHGRQVGISPVFAGQRLGLREVDTDVWLVSLMHYDLGHIDLEA